MNNGDEEPAGERFRFGSNWKKFLKHLDEQRVREAEKSIQNMLGMDDLQGLRFLDAGCGSGLFSLAARNLGARVESFDYDPESVECTRYVREQFRHGDEGWSVDRGDVLDRQELENRGRFDVVYSWGVLHHTGALYEALDNISRVVSGDGLLYIAIYNDQRWLSRYWKKVKRTYNANIVGKLAVIAIHAPYFWLREGLKRMILGGSRRPRGMDAWRDILDWLGGYPFEVARPEDIFSFFKKRGFVLERMVTVDGRHGCNEFMFRRSESL